MIESVLVHFYRKMAMPVINFTGIVLLCERQFAPRLFLGALREGAKGGSPERRGQSILTQVKEAGKRTRPKPDFRFYGIGRRGTPKKIC